MDDDFSLKRHWFYAQRPIAFGLTAEGGLLIEFDVEAAPGKWRIWVFIFHWKN